MPSRESHGMTVLRRFLGRNDRSLVPADFREALTREILLTEILRIKAVIVTVSLLVAAFSALFFLAPVGARAASRMAGSIWFGCMRFTFRFC